MARKKFNFEQALTSTLAASGGGMAASLVVDKAGEFIDNPEVVSFLPIALGAFLSQNSNKSLQAVGLGMIGASSGTLLESMGVNGVGRPQKQLAKLNPAQQQAMLDQMKKLKPVRAAGYSANVVEQQLAGALS